MRGCCEVRVRVRVRPARSLWWTKVLAKVLTEVLTEVLTKVLTKVFTCAVDVVDEG